MKNYKVFIYKTPAFVIRSEVGRAVKIHITHYFNFQYSIFSYPVFTLYIFFFFALRWWDVKININKKL